MKGGGDSALFINRQARQCIRDTDLAENLCLFSKAGGMYDSFWVHNSVRTRGTERPRPKLWKV